MPKMNWKLMLLLALVTLTGMMNGCKESGGEAREEVVLGRKVDSVLALMTLEEKLGQLTLFTSDWSVTGPVMRDDYLEMIRTGRCGNIFNAHTVAYNRELQRIAVEETRLGIPLLFGYDVIHGHKTIFPIPLAEACTWDPDLLELTARYAAMEAAASGLNWTFAPMADISRDPRWGRVAEGNGEDPFLASKITAARVKGYQGHDLSDPLTVAACVKHFAGYGASMAGRDYNTVDMSEPAFRQDYFPPYKAGIEAGAVSVMAAFNDIFSQPSHANRFLLTDLLRDEMGFTGFVVADYTGVQELVMHGVATDSQHAGELALQAGVDMDMQSSVYTDHLAASVEEGSLQEKQIDEAVRRILKVKFRLGLFDDPFRYLDEYREKEILYAPEIMEHALRSARESIVLLKNEPLRGTKVLPLESPARIAVIGPLANNQIDLLGSWHGAGDHNKVVTVKKGIEDRFPGAVVDYAEGCSFYGEDRSGFQEAIRKARSADVVILAIGEKQEHSGEAASRSVPDLPGLQEELALELLKTGKPVVILIMAERMLTFPELDREAHALLYAWHLGTRTGDAIAQVLAGDHTPSGKLVMSIPRNVGQIPVFYNHKNTGRPFNADVKYTTKYLDVENTPLYPFGYGLSYTGFSYGDMVLSRDVMGMDDTLDIIVSITNTGSYSGKEIVQLYVQDLVAGITRPVKELKGFDKIYLEPGEAGEVRFRLTAGDLAYYNEKSELVTEPGKFKVFVGPNSADCSEAQFTLEK